MCRDVSVKAGGAFGGRSARRLHHGVMGLIADSGLYCQQELPKFSVNGAACGLSIHAVPECILMVIKT